MLSRFCSRLAPILFTTLLLCGCGGGDGGPEVQSGSPSTTSPTITNPQSATGRFFGRGFPGTGSTNTVSPADLDALHAGLSSLASASPNLGDYLPAGTVFPGVSTQSASAASSREGHGNRFLPNPCAPAASVLTPSRPSIISLSQGLSTIESRLAETPGSASPTVQWAEFIIPSGFEAKNLRLTTVEAGSAISSGSFPVAVVELLAPSGAPVFSWQGGELTTDGFTFPARQWSANGLPLTQSSLFPETSGSAATGAWRLAICGGPGARAVLSLLAVPNPDPSKVGLSGNPIASGDVEIALWWDSRADIDLHLVEPDGTKVYYDALSRKGKAFELTAEDNTDGTDGFGPEAMRLMPGALPDGSGTYRLFVHAYAAWPSQAPSAMTRCLIRVKTRTETRLFSRELAGPGAGAMVAELRFVGAGTAVLTEASASAPLPWQPPQQGQQASKRLPPR